MIRKLLVVVSVIALMCSVAPAAQKKEGPMPLAQKKEAPMAQKKEGPAPLAQKKESPLSLGDLLKMFWPGPR
jgi:hypothetical protein